MEQLKFLPKLRLTEAQLQKILKDRDYETLDVSNGECASDGITYKIDGRVVEIIDEKYIKLLEEDRNAFIAFCYNIINGKYISVIDAAKEQLSYLENKVMEE